MRPLDLLVYIDAHPTLQETINIGCTIVTGLLALTPLIKRKTSLFFSLIKQSWLFLALVAISLFACRCSAFFFPHNLNPDEASFLAHAITYETYPVPWRDIDGNTSGPLTGYGLLWCVPLGIQPSYLTARIFQYFCLLGMFIFLYWAARRVAGDVAARLAILPAVVFLCWNVSADFIHYSSEEVSIFLVSFALYLITRLTRAPGTFSIIIPLGLVLGLLPFAKLQSVLFGGFLGLTAIWILFSTRHDNRRATASRILVLVTAAILPAVMILSIVAHAGALNDFWRSYICMGHNYGVQYSSSLSELLWVTNLIAWVLDPDSDLAIVLILAIVSTMVLSLHLALGLQKISCATRNWFIWAILFVFTSIATVVFSGKEFLHYQFFLIPTFTFLFAVNFRLIGLYQHKSIPSHAFVPFLLAAIISSPLVTADILFPQCHAFSVWTEETRSMLFLLLLWLIGLSVVLTFAWLLVRRAFNRFMPSFRPPSHWQKFVPLACLIPFFVIPEKILYCRPNPFRGNLKMYMAQPPSAMNMSILRERPPGGRMAIWGWAPEFSAETQTPLGTRDALTELAIDANPQRDYYRQRYLRDLRTNRPELFLEATGPTNFGYTDRKTYGIDIFPELSDFIAQEYRLDQEIDGMRLFIRRDLVDTNK